jgi:hypothetical protein
MECARNEEGPPLHWIVYCLQAMNPFAGLTGAIPLGINILKLEPAAVGALAGPMSFLSVALTHLLWETLRARPRVAAWLDRHRSARVAALLERRGVFIAALIATTLLGALPCYVTFRYLGLGFGRFWAAILLAQVAFGWAVAGLCSVAS